MKRGWLQAACCACLLVAAGGCVVPNARVYYRPSVEGGRLVAQGGEGIKSKVAFTVGGLSVESSAARRPWQKRLVVSLFLSPRPGQTVRFASDRFALRNTARGVELPVVAILGFGPEGSESPTALHRAPPRGPADFLTLDIHSPDARPKSFELVCPPIVVDGVESRFPVICFEKRHWFGLSPFNY